MKVHEAPREHYGWLALRLGIDVTGCNFRALEAVDEHGRIRGMVGFDTWTLNAVKVHVALDFPIGALLRPAFEYPFIQAGRQVLIGEIAESNRRSRRLAHRLGFHEVARITDGWAIGDDLIIYTLRRSTAEERGWLRRGA